MSTYAAMLRGFENVFRERHTLHLDGVPRTGFLTENV